MNSAPRRWTVRCGDGFELRNPQGEVVTLPYRKVEELFSLLAVRPGRPVSRSYLCAELWPTADHGTQQVNLRQTLSRLRAAIGQGNILAGRTDCSLAPDMLVAVERMPAKTNRQITNSPQADAAGPMAGFAGMVQFLAFSNPPQMLEMMRANIDLCLGMEPSGLMRALDIVRGRIPGNHPLAGWIEFWAGHAVLVGNKVDQAGRHFQSARIQAVDTKDYALVSNAVFWEGAARILLGRPGDAVRLSEMGTNILGTKDGGRYLTKVEDLRAHVLLHRGQVGEALQLLDRISGCGEPTLLEHALSEALRAFYLAAAGRSEHAKQALEFPNSFRADINHVRLTLLCELTSAIIKAAEHPKEGPAILKSLVDVFGERPAFHLEIYARESLAVAASSQGLTGEASNQIFESRRIRSKHHIAYTGWDRIRLKDLPPEVFFAG